MHFKIKFVLKEKKRSNEDTKIHRFTGEKASEDRDRERHLQKPGHTKDCQQPPEGRKKE